MTRALARPMALACVCLWLAGEAAAHPHLRFGYEVQPLVEGGQVQTLRVLWWVDELGSAQIREGVDLNRDGRLDEMELAAFARGNDFLLRPRGYLAEVVALAGGEPHEPLAMEIAEPLAATDAGAAGIVLRFTLRFRDPPPSGAFAVRFFDPTWMLALDARAPSADSTAGSTSACTTTTERFTMQTIGWGVQEVQRLKFQCASALPARPQAHQTTSAGPSRGEDIP